ncbi:MAG: AIM24 family protein, partial [Anaerolineae bacterium]
MRVELKHQPSYSLAVVTLAPNEQVKAESSAMVSFSDGVNIETKAEGGLLGGLKRAVSGESFFQNTFSAPPQGGEVTFAPSLPGDMRVIQMGGTGEFMLQ